MGLLSAVAVTAAAVKAAAATAALAGAGPLAALERRFRFSTQAALLRFSCALARRFRLGHRRWWLMAGRRNRSTEYHRAFLGPH